MEPPSASPHRGHVSWQGILLAVSPLTFWNLPTTAQLAIESVPFTAAEGTDVLLLAHNVSENVKGYTWYKGERGIDSHQIAIYLTATQGIIPGPAYSGREMVYPNGSLLFQRVTLEDTGFYTLQTLSSDLQAEKASGHICVYLSLLTFWSPHPTAQLTIEPVPSDVAEGRDVLLLVHNESGNTVGYHWYRGQVTDRSRLIVSYSNITHSATHGPAFSGREIVYPNGSLLFVNLTKEDTGFYTLQTTGDNFDTEAATGEIRVYGESWNLHVQSQ
uniref:Immunoglobulin domain-containing protein n=1 Tax=Spermophilus dauricus TaxID=99837 RepID=A0A8C9UN49_SPEDA